MFKTITNFANEPINESSGPYVPPNEAKHGQVIRHEKVDQIYRITGAGQLPNVDPSDPVRFEHFRCLELIFPVINVWSSNAFFQTVNARISIL